MEFQRAAGRIYPPPTENEAELPAATVSEQRRRPAVIQPKKTPRLRCCSMSGSAAQRSAALFPPAERRTLGFAGKLAR
jgi:hypothetical protein